MSLLKIVLFIIMTVIIGTITDGLFTMLIAYLKLNIPTLLAPLLVEGSLGKTQQGIIMFIVPTIDLIVGVSGAASILSWLRIFDGGDE